MPQKRQTIAEKIKLLRIQKGLTQDQLAHKINFPVQRIPGIENGETNITLDRLLKVCEGLEVELTFTPIQGEYDDL